MQWKLLVLLIVDVACSVRISRNVQSSLLSACIGWTFFSSPLRTPPSHASTLQMEKLSPIPEEALKPSDADILNVQRAFLDFDSKRLPQSEKEFTEGIKKYVLSYIFCQ